MAYITQIDLENFMSAGRLREATDDAHAGTANTTIVADVISRGGGIADSYVASVNGTPLTDAQVTPVLKHHVAAICAHLASQRVSAWRDENGNAPYKVDFDVAVKWFEALGQRTQLGTPKTVAPGQVSTGTKRGW